MKISFSPPYRFIITQVGCGGTGGYLVPKVARLLYCLSEHKKHFKIQYLLVDGDNVEEANLYRQNFIPADIGRNKAEVMAERYGGHFQVDIQYAPFRLESVEHLSRLMSVPDSFNTFKILFGCVDNNRARRIMHEYFQQARNIVYIDAGNGKYSGQVVVGYRNASGGTVLPSVGDLFPEIWEEEEKTPHRNCAINALEAPQNIGANDLAASLVFSILNILLTEEELNTSCLFFEGRKQEYLARKAG